MRMLFFILALLLALPAPSAFAAGNTPYTMNFSGTLGVLSGSLASTYEMRFLLTVGGTPIWCGEYDTVAVSSAGIFSVVLGENDSQGGEGLNLNTDPSTCSSPGSQAIAIDPSLLSTVTSSTAVTLEVAVYDVAGAAWETLSPSDPIPVSSALFALQADNALTATSATSASGLNSIPVVGTPSSGNILEYNGEDWVPSASGAGTPGGSNQQVQFNNSGNFGGSTTFVWTGTELGVGLSSPSTQLDVSGTNANGTFRVFDQTASTGNTREIIRAGAGQSANLTEWQNNSTAAVLASMSSTGGLTTTQLDLSGSTSGNVILKAPATGGTATYTLPATATSGDYLTTDALGNLSWAAVASGSGTVNSGTAGELAYYPASSAAVSSTADASISNGAMTLGVNASVNGTLGLAYGSAGGVTTTLASSATTTPWTLTLPPAAPTANGQVLSSTTGGVATWVTPSTGSGTVDSGTADQLAYYSADGTAVEGLASVDGGILNTSSSGVPSITAVPVLGVNASVNGTLGLAYGSAGGVTTTLASSATTTPWTLTLPPAAPTANGQVLQAETNGTSSWVTLSSGSGTVSSGSADQIAYYSATGSTVGGLTSVDGGILNTNSSGVPSISITPVLGVPSSSTGTLGLANAGSAYTTTLASSSTESGSWTLTLPPAAPTANGQVLSSTTGGVATWVTPSTGSGTVDSGTADQLAYYNATGTAVEGLASVDGGILNTSSSGVPSITAVPVLGVNASVNGTLGLAYGSAGGVTTTLASSATTTPWTLTLPPAAPTANGQVLQAETNGTSSWVTLSSGSGTVSSGSADQIAYYSATGSTVGGLTSVDGGILNTNSSGVPSISITPVLGVPSSSTGTLGLANAGSAYTTTLASSSTESGSWTLTLPPAAPTANGQVLSSTTGGVATWVTPSTGSGTVSSGSADQIAYYSATGSTVGGLTSVDGGILNTNSSGVPSISITPVLGVPSSSTGTLGLANAGNANTTTLASSSTESASWTLTLPPAAPSANGQVLSATTGGVATWVTPSTGSGTVDSGTADQLAYYNATGTAVEGLASVDGGILNTNSSGVPSISITPVLGVPSSSTGTLGLANAGNANTTTLASSSTESASWTLTLPPAAPSANGQVLSATTGGVATWVTPSTGSGTVDSGTADQLAYYNATGTAVEGLASVDGGILNTSSSGVPSITAVPVLGVNASVNGTLGLAYGSAGGVTTTLASSATTTPWTLTLPPAAPTANGQVLSSTTGGVATWVTPSTGSGTVDSGTADQLAYYNATGTAVEGLASVDGGILNTSSTGVPSISTAPVLGVPSSSTGTLGLANAGNANTTTLASSSTESASWTLTLPPAAPSANGQVLSATTGGVATWITPSTGSGTVNTGTADQLAYYSANGTAVGGLASAAGGILNTNSSGVPSITAAPVLGVPSSSTGTLGLANAGNANTTTLASSSTESASWTLTLPPAAPSANGQVLSATTGGVATWITPSSGSGTVDTGTADELAYYPSNGTTVAPLGADVTLTALGAMVLGANGTATGSVGLASAGGATTTITPSASTSSAWTLTLPTAAPSLSGQVLSATTGGVASWVTPGTGTVDTGTANQIAYYSATGTAVSGDAALTDNGTTISSSEVMSVAPSSSSTALTVTQGSTGYAATFSGGNVGVGNTSPTATLDVAGQVHAQVYSNGSGTTINWNNGNVQTTSASCNGTATQFSFSNMLEGGSYTLIVTGASSGICDFTTTGGTSVSPSGVTGWSFQPTNAATTASTTTVYTMLRANDVIYVSWITGFGTPN